MVKNRILIVVGMQGSGASLIAKWLTRCGLHTGDNFNNENNNSGFEDPDFSDSHKAILNGRRLPADGLTAKPVKPLSYDERDRLKDIISWKSSFNQQWGWNDPRTSLLLDVYNELIPQAYYFVVLKDYTSVITSMVWDKYKEIESKYASQKGLRGLIWKYFTQKRKMQQLLKKYCQQYLQVWIAYNQSVLQHLKRLPAQRVIVSDHTSLAGNSRMAFNHIVRAWDFTLKFFTFKNLSKPEQADLPSSIDEYIKDKTLLRIAGYISQSLQQRVTLYKKQMPFALVHQ